MRYPLYLCTASFDGKVRIADAEHQVVITMPPGFEPLAVDLVSSLNLRSRLLRISFSRLGIAGVVTFLLRRLGGASSASTTPRDRVSSHGAPFNSKESTVA